MKPRREGFTLLELITVAGILSFLSIMITQIFFMTIQSNSKTEVTKEVKQNGEYAMEILSRFIQNAKSLQIICDGTKQASIAVTNSDTVETVFGCTDLNGLAKIASTSALGTTYLTNDMVTLEKGGDIKCTAIPLTFTCTEVGGLPSSVTIAFSLRQQGTGQSAYEKAGVSFQSGVVIRNKSSGSY